MSYKGALPRLRAERMPVTHTRRDSDWCSGCGLHRYVTGQHREDCTLPREDRDDGQR